MTLQELDFSSAANTSVIEKPTTEDGCLHRNLFPTTNYEHKGNPAESLAANPQKVKHVFSISTMDCGLSRCSQKNLNQSLLAQNLLEFALSHWNFEHDSFRFSPHCQSTTSWWLNNPFDVFLSNRINFFRSDQSENSRHYCIPHVICMIWLSYILVLAISQ